MKKCKICGEEFETHSLYANHIRWKHKKPRTWLIVIATLMGGKVVTLY